MINKDKIAIIGMGAIVPGSETLDRYWENLVENQNLTAIATADEFGADPSVYFHPEKGRLDSCYALRGGYIRDYQFDASGFHIDPETLSIQDQQFKWCLHAARAALESAGYFQHESLGQCGVILGSLSFPTRQSRRFFSDLYAELASEMLEGFLGKKVRIPRSHDKTQRAGRDVLLSNDPSALVAQALGLRGNHYSLDAACASSLYAVKLACDELRAGRARMMLAGAVAGADPAFIQMGFSYFYAYPAPSEKSMPMDRDSAGLISGEGAGMVALKRLSDAAEDGDEILAVIEAIGLSNDGKGRFLLAPNPQGQILAYKRAYAQTDVPPTAVDYLECHATGTPLGDKTEFASIETFFCDGDGRAPRIGSVKSNVGHLLTAAGMASLLKVIMSMRHGLIPATINIDHPLTSEGGKIGPENIVRQNAAWSPKGNVPIAGINAFGFGGTNAHMVLSGPPMNSECLQTPEPSVALGARMAVVGMGIHAGACEDLGSFYYGLFTGQQFFSPLPPERWKGMDALSWVGRRLGVEDPANVRGAWLKEYEIDLLQGRIQPKEAERLTCQQTLMLKVASEAIRDAGLATEGEAQRNVAVIIAMDAEQEIHQRIGRSEFCWQKSEAVSENGSSVSDFIDQGMDADIKNAIFRLFEDHSPSEHLGFIGNIIASRIATVFDFNGPAFTVSSSENSGYKALRIASDLLATGEVDAVVLGAVDLGGSLEAILARSLRGPLNSQVESLSWNASTNGWLIGEGAGAMVLKRASDRPSGKVYAYVDDMEIVQSEYTDSRGKAGPKATEMAARTVLERQNLKPDEIGLLELSGGGFSSSDEAEFDGLTRAFRLADPKPLCAVGSATSHVGNCFAASGIVGMIKAALCLYHRFIPGVPHWEGPKNVADFSETSFYFPVQSRPWFPELGQTTLRASVSGVSEDGTSAHVILSEAGHPNPGEVGPFLAKTGKRLFPLRGETPAAVLESLSQLQSRLERESYVALSAESCAVFSKAAGAGGFVLAIVADSQEALQKEIRFFSMALAKAWNEGRNLYTPSGSYFSANPSAEMGKIALVYPGSGTVYSGMGAELFQFFPGLYDALARKVDELSNALYSHELYPRSILPEESSDSKQMDARLQVKAIPMMAIGCSFAFVLTELLQTHLRIRADSAAGFSMGEAAAMWLAQGVWDAHSTEAKFNEGPLFREKLGGAMTLVQELWDTDENDLTARWGAFLISAPGRKKGDPTLAEWFSAEIANQWPRVLLTFIHTDNEIVISGERKSIEAIMQIHNLSGGYVPLNNTAHHPFCRTLEQELYAIHDNPICSVPDMDFYSSITLGEIAIEAPVLARNAVEVLCSPVDFPALVRRLYDKGHRIFIEVGANAACTRWTKDILEGGDYLAVATDCRGIRGDQSLFRLVAALLAHKVSIDISPFYATAGEQANMPAKRLVKTIRTGGPRFDSFVKARYPQQALTGQSTG